MESIKIEKREVKEPADLSFFAEAGGLMTKMIEFEKGYTAENPFPSTKSTKYLLHTLNLILVLSLEKPELSEKAQYWLDLLINELDSVFELDKITQLEIQK